MKECLAEEVNRSGHPYKSAEKVQKADFEEITKIIAADGWDIRAANFYQQLNILCLTANVVKHRGGKSCKDLFARAPNMFRPTLLNRPQPCARHLELSRDGFFKEVDAAREFFMQSP